MNSGLDQPSERSTAQPAFSLEYNAVAWWNFTTGSSRRCIQYGEWLVVPWWAWERSSERRSWLRAGVPRPCRQRIPRAETAGTAMRVGLTM